jgi:hypothetical protein
VDRAVRTMSTQGLCEWDPVMGGPAWDLADGSARLNGCTRKATVSVGANGEWHLCNRCAGLPCFRRFRVRRPIARRVQ